MIEFPPSPPKKIEVIEDFQVFCFHFGSKEAASYAQWIRKVIFSFLFIPLTLNDKRRVLRNSHPQ